MQSRYPAHVALCRQGTYRTPEMGRYESTVAMSGQMAPKEAAPWIYHIRRIGAKPTVQDTRENSW